MSLARPSFKEEVALLEEQIKSLKDKMSGTAKELQFRQIMSDAMRLTPQSA